MFFLCRYILIQPLNGILKINPKLFFSVKLISIAILDLERGKKNASFLEVDPSTYLNEHTLLQYLIQNTILYYTAHYYKKICIYTIIFTQWCTGLKVNSCELIFFLMYIWGQLNNPRFIVGRGLRNNVVQPKQKLKRQVIL